MSHVFEIRVYYEDTDLAGIVYYANYLKYIERARTEFVRELGVDQGRLKAEQGIVFAVRRIVADYMHPAKFDDVVTVYTSVKAVTGARIVLNQTVSRDGVDLFNSEVTLVALSDAGTPTRLPSEIRANLGDA